MIACFLYPFSEICVTFANFHARDTLASVNDLLNISVIGNANWGLHSFNSHTEMLSGPRDLFGLIFLSTYALQLHQFGHSKFKSIKALENLSVNSNRCHILLCEYVVE